MKSDGNLKHGFNGYFAFRGMRKTERLIGTDLPLRGLKRGLSVNGC